MESHKGITISSINAWGFADTQKRSDVLQYLREKNFSIYCLQETHFSKQIEHIITAKWGYKVLYNSFSSNAKGLAILINNNFDYNLNKSYCDPEGDFMIAEITSNERKFLLVNLHSPNQDHPSFYDRLKQEILKFANNNIILVGDWNLILDEKMDLTNYKNINNPRCREKVLNLMVDFNLVDVWREMHPELKSYTWRRRNPFQQARLDFFLTNENIFCDIIQSNIKNS